jgi:hypothetical protein
MLYSAVSGQSVETTMAEMGDAEKVLIGQVSSGKVLRDTAYDKGVSSLEPGSNPGPSYNCASAPARRLKE